MITAKGKFQLGQLVMTPGVHANVAAAEIDFALARHLAADWGEVSPDDWKENDLSLLVGYRLLSAYRTTDGARFWIITEADRSVTTLLLPEEY